MNTPSFILIEAGRDWLQNTFPSVYDSPYEAADDQGIIDHINKLYCGGWVAFEKHNQKLLSKRIIGGIRRNVDVFVGQHHFYSSINAARITFSGPTLTGKNNNELTEVVITKDGAIELVNKLKAAFDIE